MPDYHTLLFCRSYILAYSRLKCLFIIYLFVIPHTTYTTPVTEDKKETKNVYRWRGGTSKRAEETGMYSPGFPVLLLADTGRCAYINLLGCECEAVGPGAYHR